MYFGLAEERLQSRTSEYYEPDTGTRWRGLRRPPRRASAAQRQPDLAPRRAPRRDRRHLRRRRAARRPSPHAASCARSATAAADVQVHLVTPRSFNDAQQVADQFKRSMPVILNLQSTDRELSKRLIDFASGLTYALDGGMQRIAEKIFLLTPAQRRGLRRGEGAPAREGLLQPVLAAAPASARLRH